MRSSAAPTAPVGADTPGPAGSAPHRPSLEWTGRDVRMPVWLWVGLATMFFSALHIILDFGVGLFDLRGTLSVTGATALIGVALIHVWWAVSFMADARGHGSGGTYMHRKSTTRRLSVAAVILALAASLAFAAPASAERPTSRGSAVGAFAQFTDFPVNEVPELGAIYTTRTVSAVDFASGFKALVVFEFTFTFDDAGSLVPISATVGSRFGSRVNLTVDPDLHSATSQVILLGLQCMLDADDNLSGDLTPYSWVDCGSGSEPVFLGTAPAEFEWVASGPVTHRVDNRGRPPFTCGTEKTLSVELRRAGTATGTVGGDDFSVPREAYIWSGGETNIAVEHSPNSSQPGCVIEPDPEDVGP